MGRAMRRLKPNLAFAALVPLVIAVIAALVLGTLTFTPIAAAQSQNNTQTGTVGTNSGTASKTAPPPDAVQSIRVRTSEVTAPVTVRNRSGEMVLDLTQKDFHLYDDGVEQKITHFDLGGQPFDTVLVVETSSRIQALLPAVRQTGVIFSQVVMGQTSRAAVIGFDNIVDVMQNFTSDADAVQKSINDLRVGTSGARLYDAMARGVSMLENQPRGRRRIMIVVSEAIDHGSKSQLGTVLRSAHIANITIYSIGLSTAEAALRAPPAYTGPAPIGPPGTFPVPIRPGMAQNPTIENQYEEPPANLNVIGLAQWLVQTGKSVVSENSLAAVSKSTGGLELSPKKDRAIQKAMDEIGGEMHAQYTLGYQPPGGEKPGYHTIRVTVDRPGVTVRTRPGYYIAPAVH
ncbi:MAG: VWA domain-containing protein [Candidatus Acidiferrales bacterium]